MVSDDSFCDRKLITPALIEDGIVLGRVVDGSVVTNVPHLVVHHSPTGFNFGYGGSGSADLALNIVEVVLRKIDYQGAKMRCFDGWCFALAHELYQEFKWQFIATVPEEGAVIPYETVEAWIRERMEADESGTSQAQAV